MVQHDRSGATDGAVNGKGNLIVGYSHASYGQARTGSNNLIVGDEHEYTSFGGFAAGWHNYVTGHFASVSGGNNNIASGVDSSVSGGAGLTQPAPEGWAAAAQLAGLYTWTLTARRISLQPGSECPLASATSRQVVTSL